MSKIRTEDLKAIFPSIGDGFKNLKLKNSGIVSKLQSEEEEEIIEKNKVKQPDRYFQQSREDLAELKDSTERFLNGYYAFTGRKNISKNGLLVTAEDTFKDLETQYRQKGYKIEEIPQMKNLFKPSLLLLENHRIDDISKLLHEREDIQPIKEFNYLNNIYKRTLSTLDHKDSDVIASQNAKFCKLNRNLDLKGLQYDQRNLKQSIRILEEQNNLIKENIREFELNNLRNENCCSIDENKRKSSKKTSDHKSRFKVSTTRNTSNQSKIRLNKLGSAQDSFDTVKTRRTTECDSNVKHNSRRRVNTYASPISNKDSTISKFNTLKSSDLPSKIISNTKITDLVKNPTRTLINNKTQRLYVDNVLYSTIDYTEKLSFIKDEKRYKLLNEIFNKINNSSISNTLGLRSEIANSIERYKLKYAKNSSCFSKLRKFNPSDVYSHISETQRVFNSLSLSDKIQYNNNTIGQASSRYLKNIKFYDEEMNKANLNFLMKLRRETEDS